MSINLDEMSLEDLKKLSRDVEKAIAGFESRRRKEALKAMEQVAKDFGLSVEEVVGAAPIRGKKSKTAAKYRNPKNSAETWSGRGRQPGWFKAAIAAGKKPEDLEI